MKINVTNPAECLVRCSVVDVANVVHDHSSDGGITQV